MDTVTTNEAYENLANAIVVQAVKDYPYRTRECLNFFRSDWFTALTTIEPSVIIKICEDRRIDEQKRLYNSFARSGKL